MAAPRTPGRNRREADYSNVGVAGRKTGVTLKDTGVRDEFGMEPIDGVFSSPEKQSPQRTVRRNTNLLSSKSYLMNVEQALEPAELLHTPRQNRIRLPTPHARSPLKTFLNSSPRRSLGAQSPFRAQESPIRSVGRRSIVHVVREESPPASIGSPIHSRSIPSSPATADKIHQLKKGLTQGKKRPFDFSVSSDDGIEAVYPEHIDEAELEDHALDEELLAPITMDEPMQDDLPQDDAPQDDESERQDHSEPEMAMASFEIVEDDYVPAPSSPRHLDQSDNGKAMSEKRKESGTIPPPEPQIQQKRSFQVHQDSEVEASSSRPQKISKASRHSKNHSSVASSDLDTHHPPPPPPPPPQERDPNTQKPRSKGKGKRREIETDEAHDPPPPKGAPRGRALPRGLAVLRGSTPSEDGAQYTRSGRTSVRPLAYWRNERVLYSRANIRGPELELPAIQEVIRSEEVDERPRRLGRKGHGKGKRKAEVMEESESENEGEEEEWERDTGIFHAEVLNWDPVLECGVEDEEGGERVEIALAPKALNQLTRSVKNADFRFAKTLTLPFFHSGLVDLPPGGRKRGKNSRRHHMVFWVFSGRVDVQVANAHFSIGRGGMWQVPRGNVYGIANGYGRASRILFAQGCHMVEAEGDEETV